MTIIIGIDYELVTYHKLCSFEVAGIPQTQGSKRAFVNAGRAIMVDVKHEALRSWRSLVTGAAMQAYPQAEPTADAVSVEVVFTFPRPKSHYRSGKHSDQLKDGAPLCKQSKPDVDKLLRAVFDAMTGVVWLDDSQVVRVQALKRYGNPGAQVLVETLV